jgi:hypothetical protein
MLSKDLISDYWIIFLVEHYKPGHNLLTHLTNDISHHLRKLDYKLTA